MTSAERATIGRLYWLPHGGIIATMRGISKVTFKSGNSSLHYIEFTSKKGKKLLTHLVNPTTMVLDYPEDMRSI